MAICGAPPVLSRSFEKPRKFMLLIGKLVAFRSAGDRGPRHGGASRK
jgi:hypothetical protein